MAYCLKPGKVYATLPTHLGVVVLQVVNDFIQLYGTNVTSYNRTQGKAEILVPEFKDLIIIQEDLLAPNSITPMNCLTSWIGFTSENPDAEVWVNMGINEKITPTFELS